MSEPQEPQEEDYATEDKFEEAYDVWWEKYGDRHLGCPNWPCCDVGGCGV